MFILVYNDQLTSRTDRFNAGFMIRAERIHLEASIRSAHYYTFVDPSARRDLQNGFLAAGNAMIGVYASGKPVVVGSVDRRGACGADSANSACGRQG